jgi:hypothetical protein
VLPIIALHPLCKLTTGVLSNFVNARLACVGTLALPKGVLTSFDWFTLRRHENAVTARLPFDTWN